MSVPPISPGEMQLLLSRAGLVLNPGQVADLVLAWRQVAALIASIPHDRPLADDMAYAFHLPPPASVPAAPVRVAAKVQPQPRTKARPKPKTAAPRSRPVAKAKAKAKAALKRRNAKPAGRKPARRRR
jgi:hypothetical protein